MTKEQIRERLQSLGVWERYLARRDELKAEGASPADARERAFREVTAIETAIVPADAATLKTARRPRPYHPAILKGKRAVVKTDIEFVYEHMDDDGLQPNDAPSSGAWSLWSWARSTRDTRMDFYCNFAAKLLTGSVDESPGFIKDDGRPLRHLEKDLAAWHKKEAARKLAAEKSREMK